MGTDPPGPGVDASDVAMEEEDTYLGLIQDIREDDADAASKKAKARDVAKKHVAAKAAGRRVRIGVTAGAARGSGK